MSNIKHRLHLPPSHGGIILQHDPDPLHLMVCSNTLVSCLCPRRVKNVNKYGINRSHQYVLSRSRVCIFVTSRLLIWHILRCASLRTYTRGNSHTVYSVCLLAKATRRMHVGQMSSRCVFFGTDVGVTTCNGGLEANSIGQYSTYHLVPIFLELYLPCFYRYGDLLRAPRVSLDIKPCITAMMPEAGRLRLKLTQCKQSFMQ